MKNEILEAREMVENSMKRLSAVCVSEKLCMEYLYLVVQVMQIYEKYGEAIDDENEEKILDYADQIVCKIDFELEEGILKTR